MDEPGLRFLVVGLVDILVAGRHNYGEEGLGLPPEMSVGITVVSMIDCYCVYQYLVLFC